MFDHPIIAAVRAREDIEKACLSKARDIFLMCGELISLKHDVDMLHGRGKRVFVHPDLVKGLASDKEGIEFLAKLIGPEGIVSTKNHLIKAAKDAHLLAVQHLFIIDTQAFNTSLRNVKEAKPDAIEIMPGLMPRVVAEFASLVEVPILAAGLVRSIDEAKAILDAGARAVITGKSELWALDAFHAGPGL
jgi:glycerol uptake operon antiterminator